MKSFRPLIATLLGVVLVTTACDAFGQIAASRQLNLPESPFRYSEIQLPEHVRKVAARFDNTPSENPITDHGATLGRVLFYDTRLSADATVACATCHQQSHAFAQPLKTSLGLSGASLPRNSMSLFNLRYQASGKFFWDERAESLEVQVLMPIEHPEEMGHSIDELVVQLQADPAYPSLFAAAFGDQVVTSERISRSLAQFVRSIISFGSRYDIGRAAVASVDEPFPNFTDEENLGKEQFFGRGRCAECHLPDEQSLGSGQQQTVFFQTDQLMSNGIDTATDDADQGRGGVTGRADDVGKFKSTSLRNIERTAPYMHDGRFATLAQVIEHYNWSVRPHPNLDGRLQDFADFGLALPEVEKIALEKFLLTLTDEALITNPMYSDPWVCDPWVCDPSVDVQEATD